MIIRNIIKTVVLLALIYFAGGFILVQLNWPPAFTDEIYLEFAAIFGGTASVFGLLGLALPRITTKDLQEVELGSLRKIADLAEKMQTANNEYSKRSGEINKLRIEKKQIESEKKQAELKKKKIELLARKVSMELHLQQTYESNIEQITKLYKDNKKIEERLQALGTEIQRSGDQDIINEIIENSKIRLESESLSDNINNIIWLKPTFFGIGIDLNALFDRMLNINKKR